jgi:hypothetical protein
VRRRYAATAFTSAAKLAQTYGSSYASNATAAQNTSSPLPWNTPYRDRGSEHAEPDPKQSYTIDDAIKVYKKWLILPSTTPVYALLGTVSANLLPGPYRQKVSPPDPWGHLT